MDAPGRRNSALAEFLRTRRALLEPGEVGISDTRRRRVSGLRRDELARRAKISVPYYTRLEQGKHATASHDVLESIATALLLPPAERDYLHRLAAAERADHTVGAPADESQARPETIRLLDALGAAPGFVLGPNMDVLATNAAAFRLWPPTDNAIHWLLFDPVTERLFGDDRTCVAAELISMLRLHAARKPTHPGIRRVIADLEVASEFFREVWAGHTVSMGIQRAGSKNAISETLAVKLADDQSILILIPA